MIFSLILDFNFHVPVRNWKALAKRSLEKHLKFFNRHIAFNFSLLFYSDAIILDCFQVKTRPGIRFLVQNYRLGY